MSAIADFRLIQTQKLQDLLKNADVVIERKLFRKKVIDNYWSFLDAHSQKLKEFEWSGYVFANLFIFLEEKGIDLLNSKYNDLENSISQKRENATILLTFEQRQKYAAGLLPEKFDVEELIQFNIAFSEEDDRELAIAQIEAIKALREYLESIPDENHVVLLSIG